MEPTLIDELQKQGELDSSGAFTLDPTRARELLRNCQLSEPHLYILSLASALVGLDATALHLRQRPDGLQLVAPGARLDPELVANPLGGLFSRIQPAWRELAVGVNSALGAAGASLEIHAGGRRGFYRQDEFRWEEAPPTEELSIELRRAHQGAEARALVQAFPHIPIELTVDGQKQGKPLVVPPDSCAFWFAAARTSPANRLLVAPSQNLFDCPHSAPLSACLMVGAGPSACHWIFLGRTYPRPLPFELEGSDLGLQLFVACDQVDKDLSLEHLLDNQRYQRVCTYLRQLCLQAIETLWEHFLEGRLVEARAAAARPLLVYAVELSAAAGKFDQARDFQRTLSQVYGSEAARRLDRYRMALLYRQPCETPSLQGETPLDEYWALTRSRLALLVPPRDPTTLSMLHLLGLHAVARGRWELGVKAMRPFLESEPNDSQARAVLGTCLLHLGQVEEARELLAQAVVGNKADWALDAMEHLATAEARLGQLKQAASTLAQVLRQRQIQWGSRSCRLGVLLNRLAVLCEQLNDVKTARYYQEWSRSLHLR